MNSFLIVLNSIVLALNIFFLLKEPKIFSIGSGIFTVPQNVSRVSVSGGPGGKPDHFITVKGSAGSPGSPAKGIEEHYK